MSDVLTKLPSRFEKHHGGEYFAHLNGSDIIIRRINSSRWDWTVEGRAHARGSSKSLKYARIDAWIESLNDLELDAYRKGLLEVP